MTDARQLAKVNDYDGLMDALRARADDLDVSRNTLDAISGLATGYCGKLLASVPIRAVGPTSLGPLLQALGLALIVVEDHTAFAKIEKRLQRKKRHDASDGMLARKRKTKRAVWQGNSEWGKLMQCRQVLKMSPIQLERRARAAARARWQGKRHRDANAAKV